MPLLPLTWCLWVVVPGGLGEGERREQGRREKGKNYQDILTLAFYGFIGQWLQQRLQTWPTTSPSDTLFPGPDVCSKEGNETDAVSSWLWMVADARVPWGERICCLGRLWLFWRVEIPWEVGELGGEGPCFYRGVRWPDSSIFWQLTTLTWSSSVDFSSWVPVGDVTMSVALQPTLQQRSLLALPNPQGSLTDAHQHPSITWTRESLPPKTLYPTSDNHPWQNTGIPETKSKAFELLSLLPVAHSEIWAECRAFTHWMGVKLLLCASRSR